MQEKNLRKKYLRNIKRAPKDYCPIRIYYDVYYKNEMLRYFPPECYTCDGNTKKCEVIKKDKNIEGLVEDLKKDHSDKMADKKKGTDYWGIKDEK